MSRARIVIATVVALFATLTLLERFALIELLLRRAAVPLLLAAAEALAIVACGALLRRSRPIDVPLDFLAGYPLFGTICFLVGTLQVSPWTMVPLLAAGALGGAWMLSHFGAMRPSLPPPNGWIIPIAFVIGCGFVFAQMAPMSPVELSETLAIPRTWALEGRAVDLPLLSQSYLPLGIESADLPLLAVLGANGGIGSHFLHLLAMIAAGLLIARRTQSWLLTAAIVTTPALALAAGVSLPTWPLAGLFVALAVALESDDDRTAMAATAAGLLTHYAFIPFALVAWIAAKKWRAALPAIAIGSVFFIRNVILTGNPIAPLFGPSELAGVRGLFLADYVFETPFMAEALGATLLALCVFATGRIAIASLIAGIVLFFFAPSARLLALFLMIPAMSASSALQRRFFAAMIAIAIVVQTLVVAWFTQQAEPAKERPAHESIVWLNGTLPRSSRTLVVGLGETYWLSHPARGASRFDSSRITRYLDVPTPDALHARLRRDGITHVAVFSDTKDPAALAPPAQKKLAQVLDRYAASVSTRGNVALFTLR